MRYGGVSGWEWRGSVTAWLRDMRKGQLWERGKDVQHIVFVLFKYSDIENSIGTLARELCFLLPGQCIESLWFTEKGHYIFISQT